MKFLKKIICALLLCVLLCSLVPARASAATQDIRLAIGYVNVAALRLRAAPSLSAATLDMAYQNEAVVILELTGNWFRVIYNLQEGYMHAKFLTVSTVKNVELGYGKVTHQTVNMRSGPSTGYSILGQSSKGDLAYTIGFNKGWYKVIWNGQICYIRSDYLALREYPYENLASKKSPLFFINGRSTGTPVSVQALYESENYISGHTATGDKIVATAKQYIGVPYVWGGTSPSGFDCSGLTYYVFQKHGITLSRTVAGQYTQGYSVSKDALQVGDLVFFQTSSTDAISHVGIYVGDGQFIHASSSRGVMISSLSNTYWSPRYYGARRVL